MFQLLEQNNLTRRPSQWETIDHTGIIDDFPVLSEEELGDITFGTKLKLSIFFLILILFQVFTN
jgi:hypothetical protein